MSNSAASFDWTDERVARLKKLFAQGLSAASISLQLGCNSRNAVIGKIHRLGLARAKPAAPAQPAPLRAKLPRGVDGSTAAKVLRAVQRKQGRLAAATAGAVSTNFGNAGSPVPLPPTPPPGGDRGRRRAPSDAGRTGIRRLQMALWRRAFHLLRAPARRRHAGRAAGNVAAALLPASSEHGARALSLTRGA